MNNGSYSRWRNHPPHHYALCPNFTVFKTDWVVKHSSFLRRTNLLPSDPKKLNLDSSLKWNIFHCSCVHRMRSVAKSRRTFWFFFEIKGCNLESIPLIFPYMTYEKLFFLRLTFPFAHKMDVAVSLRSFKDILTISQSSSLVVIGGPPVLGFCSGVLSALTLLITW